MITLDYKNQEVRATILEFEFLVEEIRNSNDSEDFLIETNNFEVQGALLETIEKLNLEHRIELGGKIFVTIE